MARPEGIPDPRDPSSPTRVDDPIEDHARAEVTVAELIDDPTIVIRVGMELPAEPLILPEISPERMAELRRRRDLLIPLIRRILGGRE